MANKPQHKVRLPPSAADFVKLGDAPGSTPVEKVAPVEAPPPVAVQPASMPAAQPAKPEKKAKPPVASKRRVETRKDGRELRKQTIYLPTDLYRRIRMHAAANDVDMSELTIQALEAFLPK